MEEQVKKVHLISIGGAVMHNFALALDAAGFKVQGSDDEIYEPSRSRLAAKGLLPEKMGWHPEKIDSSIDFVILGMHARSGNPEIEKAKELGIPIYSFPEYFANCSSEKTRVAVAGSHGKTTITSMILHVLKKLNKSFDYLVGSNIDGFDLMVSINNSDSLAIIEADEYPSSALDSRPKFIWYQPQISVITGIAWDHMNVFPTVDIYQQQFADFLDSHPDGASVIYYQEDRALVKLIEKYQERLNLIPYSAQPYETKDEQTLLTGPAGNVSLRVFGKHNIENLSAAHIVCMQLGISDHDFYQSISNFTGAKKRLEKIFESKDLICFRDFCPCTF